ncbi:MAG: hypothetical protein JST85_04415 [Acidobacteria bacterium]|nr:hypothetical protein [Acidobacteriota bacterium]
MKITRRLKITVTQRRTVGRLPVRAFCTVCSHLVETLAHPQAAEMLEIDEQGIAELIAAGRIHAIASAADGCQRICQESLFARRNL